MHTGAQVTRDKNVIKPARGKRQCNCRDRMVTRQLGPGMFQQFTQKECEECDAVQFVREAETLTVHVEPGMQGGQVRTPAWPLPGVSVDVSGLLGEGRWGIGQAPSFWQLSYDLDASKTWYGAARL